ncbi:MAG: 6-phosphogluconolactonase, partial [Ghiorsea sp.]
HFKMNIQFFDHADADAVALATVEAVIKAAQQAIAERGVFHWVLAGGTTPKQAYILLRDAEIEWAKEHVWFGDERCLPVGDQERNDHMADQALLQHVAIPKEQIHGIAAEMGAEKAAALYHNTLNMYPAMDLVLLGMGEDGHTASLFPNNPALQSENMAVAVFNSPKPPSDRVSMGYTVLNHAKQCIVLVTGEGKRHAWQQIQAGVDLPVARVSNALWLSSLC